MKNNLYLTARNKIKILSIAITGVLLLLLWRGMSVPAYADQDSGMAIHLICDPYPPGSITDLATAYGNDTGEIKLFWSAPGDDGNTGQLISDVYPYNYPFVYFIKISVSSPDDYGGSATSWWDISISTKEKWLSNALSPGLQEEEIIEGLNSYTTYWVGIKARDKTGNWSEDLSVVPFMATWDVWAPNTVTDLIPEIGFEAGEVELIWTAPADVNNDGIVQEYNIKYATFNVVNKGSDIDIWWNLSNDVSDKVFIPSPLPAGNSEKLLLTGLRERTTYYFAIKTVDDAANISDIDLKASNLTQKGIVPLSYSTYPAVIVDLEVQSTNNPGEVLLGWTSPDDGYSRSVESYIIKYATCSILNLSSNTTGWWIQAQEYNNSIIPSIPGTGESCLIKNLTGNITYYFSVKSVNRFNTLSNIDFKSQKSTQDTVVPKAYNIKPYKPGGVKIEEIKENGNVIISWTMVHINVDGSKYENRGGYKVYRSDNYSGGWKVIHTINTDTEQAFIWEDTTSDADSTIRYYFITAVDKYGNESEPSIIIEASQERKLIVQDISKKARVEIPYEISSILYAQNNECGEDLVINIEKEFVTDNNTLKVYKFNTVSIKDGEIVDIVFDKAKVKIEIDYETRGGYISGAPQEISVSEAEKQLALYWYNSIEWIKIGGKVDTANDTVSIYSRSFGKYALRVSYLGDSFEVIGIQPDKIFTPKSEFMNFIEFKYHNPKEGRVTGKIYDLRGAYVASMESGNTGSIGDESGSLIWAGRDSNGSYVSGGVYIYQIEISGAEDKVINGTVVVAR